MKNEKQVQRRVNAILKGNNSNQLDTVAREVIAGKWGNGATRFKRLRRAGYNPIEVQKRVHELLH